MTKLDDVARVIRVAFGRGDKSECARVAKAAITAYDNEPTVEEIEAAAIAAYCEGDKRLWDQWPDYERRIVRDRIHAALFAARRVRLVALEEKKP